MFLNKSLIPLSVRLLHSSAILTSEAKAMRKILKGSKTKKHHFADVPLLPSPKAFSEGSYEGKRSPNARRTAVLNKLFMRYVTDLMATGDYSTTFSNYNVEINRVQVTPDFNCINVYWLAKGTENDEEIEKILQAYSGLLRHELSQLKVIGVVPRIAFVKDKSLALIMEVDRRLAIADFGEDYIPTEPAARLKSQLQLFTKLSPEIQKKIEKLDNEIELDDDKELPPMADNVFGLNHTDIMNRITKSINKNKESEEARPTLEQIINKNPINDYTNRTALKEFLFKRQLLREKIGKPEKNYRPELEILEEEWEQQKEKATPFKKFDVDDDDDDYIDEDLK